MKIKEVSASCFWFFIIVIVPSFFALFSLRLISPGEQIMWPGVIFTLGILLILPYFILRFSKWIYRVFKPLMPGTKLSFLLTILGLAMLSVTFNTGNFLIFKLTGFYTLSVLISGLTLLASGYFIKKFQQVTK